MLTTTTTTTHIPILPNTKHLCPFRIRKNPLYVCVCVFYINVDVDAKLSGICTSEFA